jgi:hypothetical protein
MNHLGPRKRHFDLITSNIFPLPVFCLVFEGHYAARKEIPFSAIRTSYAPAMTELRDFPMADRDFPAYEKRASTL